MQCRLIQRYSLSVGVPRLFSLLLSICCSSCDLEGTRPRIAKVQLLFNSSKPPNLQKRNTSNILLKYSPDCTAQHLWGREHNHDIINRHGDTVSKGPSDSAPSMTEAVREKEAGLPRQHLYPGYYRANFKSIAFVNQIYHSCICLPHSFLDPWEQREKQLGYLLSYEESIE